MQEHNSDRLEEFFRKAAARPDVSFNEDDWKKLEARLDAEEGALIPPRATGLKVAAGVLIAAVLLISGGLWLNSHYQLVERVPEETSEKPEADQRPSDPHLQPQAAQSGVNAQDASKNMEAAGITLSEATSVGQNRSLEKRAAVYPDLAGEPGIRQLPDGSADQKDVVKFVDESIHENVNNNETGARPASENIHELTPISPAIAVKIKQKAVVDLPGAEEEDRREAHASVKAEHASVQKEHSTAPRLSLLLSFAPDFSTTSLSSYSGPGKAYGGIVRYHILNRWSVSAGVIKNDKKYTGSGEYYNPPTGYWKRNTNGIIPSTIDGSCSLLEFPLMIQYTVLEKGHNRWIAGAGASSYLMQSEAYQYNFEEPNPGAKAGWSSKGSSRFFFNMVNFAIAYEHQVAPGLMVGLEPYVKIPIEEIGWSNLKLFSTGASVTMRYTFLRKSTSLPTVSRPPD